MEERLAKLLKIVIDEYVATAESVGSEHLVKRYRLGVSPATVRHWFGELEEEGYLTQPHTSGGRIPTEKGFRWYIEHFVHPSAVARREREALKRVDANAGEAKQLRTKAQVLAELTGQAIFIAREMDMFYTGLAQLFAQPEFQDLRQVVSVSEFLDHLDETIKHVRHLALDGPKIFIGEDCPFGPDCASVVMQMNGGVLGVVGPMRMNYQRVISLLDASKEDEED